MTPSIPGGSGLPPSSASSTSRTCHPYGLTYWSTSGVVMISAWLHGTLTIDESARLNVTSMRAASSRMISAGVIPSAFCGVEAQHLIVPAWEAITVGRLLFFPVIFHVLLLTWASSSRRSATSLAFSAIVAKTITSCRTLPSCSARASVQPHSAAASCVLPAPRGTWSSSSLVIGRPSGDRRDTNMASTHIAQGISCIGPRAVTSCLLHSTSSSSRCPSHTTPDPGRRSSK